MATTARTIAALTAQLGRVILGKDDTDINRNLHVEVAGHDGKDHKDDAIAVARDVLAHLK